jgi:hypothetical protein
MSAPEESSRTMVSFTEQKNFQKWEFAFFKNNSLLIGNYCIPPACNQIGNRCGKHMAAMPIAATPVAQKIVCPETRDCGRYQGVRKILPQGSSDISGIKF